ncbi:MAG: hypothetical protein ACYC4L_05355 [Chloroflexota bacterium]
MAEFVDAQGRVVLTLEQLQLLHCPRQAFWHGREDDSAMATTAAVRRACGDVLGALAGAGWPADSFDRLPSLVARALLARWRFGLATSSEYHHEVAHLTNALRRFLRAWRPPSGLQWQVEPNARWQDWREQLVLRGSVMLALSPSAGAAGPGVVYDFCLDALPSPADVPLAAVGLASLARARLGLQCDLEVRFVAISTGQEWRWTCGSSQLAREWRRLQRLAANLRADSWPANPGHRCAECSVGNCEVIRATAEAPCGHLAGAIA